MSISALALKLVSALVGIVIVIILFTAFAPIILESLGNLSSLGIPLASLFSPTGIVMVLVVIGIFIGIIALALPKGK